MLRFEVKNLGPIAEGSVDLKPLTIFVGANSSGKSYMATLMYAVSLGLRQSIRRRSMFTPLRDPFASFIMALFRKEEAVKADWEAWVGGIADYGELACPLASLPQSVKKFLTEAIGAFIRDKAAHNIDSEMKRCYGASIASILSLKKAPLSLSIRQAKPRLELGFTWVSTALKPSSDGISLVEHRFEISQPRFDFPGGTFTARMPATQLRLQRLRGNSFAPERGEWLLDQIAREISMRVFEDLPPAIHYLPAARSGILQAHKGLAGYTIKGAPLVGIEEPVDIPRFTGVIADFLYTVLNIEPGAERKLSYLASRLEEDITKGKIVMEAEKHLYPEILYHSEGVGTVPLHRTSSGISELAPLILFLKYVVEPGDLLIIEEPEAHLHPAAQRKLASVLVGVVRAHVTVIITTHSDYLTQQLSNFVALGKITEADRVKGGYAAEDYLDPDEVGAYLFRFDEAKGGTVVEKVEVNSEEGINAEEFGKVAEELYEQSVTLQQKVLRDK